MKTLARAAILAAGLQATWATATTLEIVADTTDTVIRSDGVVAANTAESMRVGGNSGTTDSNGVFPFALPAIPEGEEILSANIRIYLEGVTNRPGPVDAYILPARPAATFSADDFYQGTYKGDPDATALQDDIWTMDSPAGAYLLSDVAAGTLRQFIIDQYANGAQEGDFVVFRLGPSLADESSFFFFLVSSANHATPENRPTLILETFDGNYTPSVQQVELQSVEVGGTVSFDVAGHDENPDDVLTFSSSELPGFVTLENNENNTATLTAAPQSGDAGLYTFSVTVSDGSRSSDGSVSIVVTGAGGGTGVPVFDTISPVSIDQGDSASVNISVTDADDTTVEISAVNVPSFATFTDNGDMSATLAIDSSYADAHGTYTVYLIAQDDDNHVAVTTLIITLNEVTFAPGYYCDPENGDISNDGSPRHPWPSLALVMAANKPLQPGDVIYLRDGYHGEARASAANDDYVYIRAAEGHSPTLSKLTVTGDYWDISGISISRSYAPTYSKATMVTIGGQHNIVHGCEIFAMPSVEGWDIPTWQTYTCDAASITGSYNTLEDCDIRNIDMAIATGTGSTFITIRGNHIQNFSGDGIRVLGNDQLVEYNYIADCYDIDLNHDDGIQGWSVADGQAGTGTGVTARNTIRGNYIIETTDPTRPLNGPLQGIGLFDGMFDDWVIENNVILVNQWQGIAIFGARRCRVINNTVVDQVPSEEPGPTWIRITHHKKFASAAPNQLENYRAKDNIVRNNLCMRLRVDEGTSEVDSNFVMGERDLSAVFKNFPDDLRLLNAVYTVNQGSSVQAPATDITGAQRAGLPDIGAYEFFPRTWAGYPTGAGEWTNTQELMGWVYTRYTPWIYHAEAKTWIYLREEDLTSSGAWAYIAGLVPANSSPTTDEGTWAGYPVVNGWMSTSIGPAYRAGGPWIYFNLLHTWTVAQGVQVSPSGAWVYIVRADRSDTSYQSL